MCNYAIARPTSTFSAHAGSRGQGGAVLAVVLVVLVAMMLGGVSLLSSVDTSALLSGNIGFKRHSINSSGLGLNDALNVMKNQANFRAKQESVAAFVPSRSPWRDVRRRPARERPVATHLSGPASIFIPACLKPMRTAFPLFSRTRPSSMALSKWRL